MQLSLFKKHEYSQFFNYLKDANEIIKTSDSKFQLSDNAVVLKIINDHAIWFYNQNEGDDPNVYFWSTRSISIRYNGKLSEFNSKYL